MAHQQHLKYPILDPIQHTTHQDQDLRPFSQQDYNMDVNKVLQHFVKWDKSLPAIKLAWNCELDLEECDLIPRLSPSHYKSEILLSTNERYSLLCRQQRKFELHKSGFDLIAVPSIVVFQNYRIGQKYSSRLSLRNIGKMSQKATFFMDESNGFYFDEGCSRIAKFAPGMTVTVNINFIPEDDIDYYHKIIISTKTSRFAVPILGIGSRGIIDLPDVFDFGDVPVKVLKKKCVMAYNTGAETARFTLTTDGCFSVKPERGVVAAKDSFPFELSFYADYKQPYEGYVLIKYDNDEEVHCLCKANAIDADISISPNEIGFYDTYLGMKSSCNVVIFNNSDEIVDFSWTKYLITAGSNNSLEEGAGGDTAFHKRSGVFIFGSGGAESRRHMNLESQYQTTEIENAFYHENFVIEPLLGKLQPRSSTDVLIMFSPTAHLSHQIEAYLNVTGLEGPIIVPITGNGLGPEFKFAFQELDIGTVFLGGSHHYEIAVVNTSQIEGTIKFDKIVSPVKDVSIQVEPEKLVLAPDQYGAFYVNLLCGGLRGDFTEKLRFTALRANYHHVICIKGVKVFPSMHFSLSELAFGDVPYGFPKSKQVLLINDSLNTVAIVLGISEEGTDEPIDIYDLMEFHLKKHESEVEETNPREFTIEPSKFTLHPRGFQRITVTVCGKKCRDIVAELALRISADEGQLTEPTLTLPIMARCRTPALQCTEPELNMTDAFLHFSNTGEFSIKNSSELSACYVIVPVFSQAIRSEWKKLIGIAKPRAIISVPFTFTASSPGESSASYELYALGRDDKLGTITVNVTASAAKLAVSSKVVNFGNVNILTPSGDTVDIINESPLTIPFTIHLIDGGQNGDRWEFEPESSTMEPESKNSIQLRTTLREIGIHNALLRVQMQEAANYIDIKLTATGTGTCLFFTPHMDNPFDLRFGNMFTKDTKTYTVEVTNMGYSTKILEWLHVYDDPPEDESATKRFFRVAEPPKNKKKPIRKERHETVFTIVPQKKTLTPMASTTMSFTATSHHSQVYTEEYNLWIRSPNSATQASLRPYEKSVPRRSRIDINAGKKPYQESLKPVVAQTVKMIASFEAPKLTFSRQSMLFKIDAFPTQVDFIQEDLLKIENKGTLPITGMFETKFPFSMKVKHLGVEDDVAEWTHTFEAGEQIMLTITFDGQHLRKDRGTYRFDTKMTVRYEGHAESEAIILKGEVNFPQVQIDRDVFDIGIIGNGTEAVEEFSVTNPCNFCLSYKWFIKPRSTEVEYEPGEMDKLCFELECEENIETHKRSRNRKRQRKRNRRKANKLLLANAEGSNHDTDMGMTRKSFHHDPSQTVKVEYSSHSKKRKTRTSFHIASKSRKATLNLKHVSKRSSLSSDSKDRHGKHEDHPHRKSEDLRRSSDKKASESSGKKPKDASKELDHYGDWVQFVRNKYFRSRMMETIGLHDSSLEKEDEINYLTYNRVEPKTINNSFAISQLIDIVPLAGIIQAGQTQNFVLVFYGHSNVKLKSTAICYIEGGTSKAIQITAQSTHIDDADSITSPLDTETPSVEVTTILPNIKSDHSKDEEVEEIANSGVTEIVDNFKHRCAMRPSLGKKKAIRFKK